MFPISMITGEPLWNSLPAAKIINYPLEKADYKPYAQARVCISNDDLHSTPRRTAAGAISGSPRTAAARLCASLLMK